MGSRDIPSRSELDRMERDRHIGEATQKLNEEIVKLKRDIREVKQDRRFLSIMLNDSKFPILISYDPELVKKIKEWAEQKE